MLEKLVSHRNPKAGYDFWLFMKVHRCSHDHQWLLVEVRSMSGAVGKESDICVQHDSLLVRGRVDDMMCVSAAKPCCTAVLACRQDVVIAK